MRRALTIMAAVVAVVSLSGSAGAVRGRVMDPNDTRGPLDVRRVDTFLPGGPASWTIVTWNRWTARSIWDSGYLTIFFDRFGSERPDYYVLIRSDGSQLKGYLFRDRRRAHDRRISYVKVYKPSKNSVRVRVRLAKMAYGKRRVTYSWFVKTLNSGPRCRRVCFDRAPDRASVVEPLHRAQS
jgi:hypothetical protein